MMTDGDTVLQNGEPTGAGSGGVKEGFIIPGQVLAHDRHSEAVGGQPLKAGAVGQQIEPHERPALAERVEDGRFGQFPRQHMRVDES